MDSIIRTFLSSGVVQARAKKAINGASLFVGAWTMSHLYDWMTAHATYFSQASDAAIAGSVAAAAAGIVLAVGSAVWSQMDVSNVNAKIVVAAATGDPAAANDKDAVAQVKAVAGTPAALAALVAKLKMGQV